jgi:intracellular septation protein A
MSRVLTLLKFVIAQFGTLVVFYALLYTLGLKAAIGGAIVFVILDGVRRRVQGEAFPKLYILTSLLTFVFGGIDLMAETPFMIKYEAVITSAVLAVTFAYSVRGAKPMLQTIAEEQTKQSFADRPDIRAFFVLLTFTWVGYFVLRAITYLWLGETLPIEEVMKIRPIIGSASLLVMFAISFQGRRLFLLLERLGLLPAPAGPVAVKALGAEVRAAE